MDVMKAVDELTHWWRGTRLGALAPGHQRHQRWLLHDHLPRTIPDLSYLLTSLIGNTDDPSILKSLGPAPLGLFSPQYLEGDGDIADCLHGKYPRFVKLLFMALPNLRCYQTAGHPPASRCRECVPVIEPI
jgi:hypothetical protein